MELEEQWRPIRRFEHYYEVSNLGRIRSIGTGQGRRTGRLINGWLNNHGYRHVELQVNNRGIAVLVHVLVTEAFLGPCPIFKEIDHIDGNKRNNVVSNLRYVTRSENMLARNERLRAAGLPLTGLQHGEHNPQAKLTKDQVSEIRRLYKEGMLQRELAEKFKVNRSAIGKIVRNERWV
jgi:hypothetical protein